MLDLAFLETFDSLSKLNEEYESDNLELTVEERAASADAFNAAANEKVLDLDSFHRAYDVDLKELGLFSLFNLVGRLAHKGTYGEIKGFVNQKHPAVKALKRLWVLQFIDGGKSQADIDKRKKDIKDRIAAEDKSREERKKQKSQLEDQIFELVNAKLWSEYVMLMKSPTIRPKLVFVYGLPKYIDTTMGTWDGTAVLMLGEIKIKDGLRSVQEAVQALNAGLPHLIDQLNEEQ